MIDLVTLTDVTRSHSAARVLRVVKTAVESLTHTFVIVQDDFSDALDERPTELRTVVLLRVHDAQLRVEVTILSVTVCNVGYAADFAFKVIETDLNYNVTLDDHDRLLAGIKHLFDSATEIHLEGYEDSLCFRLQPSDLDV